MLSQLTQEKEPCPFYKPAVATWRRPVKKPTHPPPPKKKSLITTAEYPEHRKHKTVQLSKLYPSLIRCNRLYRKSPIRKMIFV